MENGPSKICWGVHPVQALLESGRQPVEKLYFARGRGGRALQAIIQEARRQGVPYYFEPKPVLDRLSGTTKHQGIVAVLGLVRYRTVDEMLALARERDETPLLLLLDGVEDPRNLGAILRTAEAAGVHGVILPRHRAAGLTATALKTAAGSAARLPVARVTNLSQWADRLKAGGFWLVGLESSASQQYTDVELTQPVLLVVGGEGAGIRSRLLERCDFRVRIPMCGKVESLNVSVAAGVLLYEVWRQRRTQRPSGSFAEETL